jgi:hypothetical protein
LSTNPEEVRPMALHDAITPAEAADRLALREVFDAYAHCADRRDAEGQKALFTEDARFAVYMNGPGSEPSYVLEGREALTPVFDDLNRYEATTHFNGQSAVDLDGERASGESYTIAHHPLHRKRGAKDHDRLAPLPGHVREDRRTLVLRRTQTHPRLERDTAVKSRNVISSAHEAPSEFVTELRAGLRALISVSD